MKFEESTINWDTWGAEDKCPAPFQLVPFICDPMIYPIGPDYSIDESNAWFFLYIEFLNRMFGEDHEMDYSDDERISAWKSAVELVEGLK